jgi:serralysin
MVIDLAPGGWSDVDSDTNFQAARLDISVAAPQWARGQVFNALQFNGDPRSLIENAIGGAGNDWIKGNQANNRLFGADGRDILEGFDGNDDLDAGTTAGGSEMYGGNQHDELWAGPGADYIDGGNGTDNVNYSRSDGPIQIDTTAGKVLGSWAFNDTILGVENITATAFDDSLRTGDGTNWILGGAGWDNIDGGNGNDFLFGQDGNDTILGGAGGDTVNGGGGWDIATFSTAVSINLSTGVHGGQAAGDTFSSIEQFNGSPENDVMNPIGNVAAYFAGGDGADTLYGANFDDWLQGGKGGDYMHGDFGSDTASYADAPAGITAELYFSDGTTDGKVTAGDWGFDTLISIENIEGTNFFDILYGDERANKLWGLGGDDELAGDKGSAAPPPSNDQLYGGDGNDSLDGGGGSDLLVGGNGNDTFFVDTDFDQVRESAGGGYDTVFASADFRLHATLAEVEQLHTSNAGATDPIDLRGSNFGNTLVGNAGANTLDGYGGDDFIMVTPDAATDVLIGGDGRDTMLFTVATVADWQAGVLDPYVGLDSWLSWEAIWGSQGDDRIRTNSWGFAVELRGGLGNDVLATGVSGVVGDILRGQDGDDELNGGAGNDLLVGGRGSDLLTGGPGFDRFDYNAIAESTPNPATRDVITDFTVNPAATAGFVDRLDFATIDAKAATAGNQAFTFIGTQAFTAEGQIRVVQSGTDAIVLLNIAGAGIQEMAVVLQNVTATTLAVPDFIL